MFENKCTANLDLHIYKKDRCVTPYNDIFPFPGNISVYIDHLHMM